MKTTNNNFALVLIIAFTGKQSYYNGQYMYLFTEQFSFPGISVNELSPLLLRRWNIRHFTFDFHRLKMADSLLEEVTSPRKRELCIINNTDKTLITCLMIFLFSIGNCHFNDIWHFVDWINFIGIAWFLSMYFIYL